MLRSLRRMRTSPCSCRATEECSARWCPSEQQANQLRCSLGRRCAAVLSTAHGRARALQGPSHPTLCIPITAFGHTRPLPAMYSPQRMKPPRYRMALGQAYRKGSPAPRNTLPKIRPILPVANGSVIPRPGNISAQNQRTRQIEAPKL